MDDARYIGHCGGGLCEIGVAVSIKGSGDSIWVQTRHRRNEEDRYQVVSVIEIPKKPETEEEELQLGKQLEIAGYGLWRDLYAICSRHKWGIMGEHEFKAHYTDCVLDELKRK